MECLKDKQTDKNAIFKLFYKIRGLNQQLRFVVFWPSKPLSPEIPMV